MKRGLIAALSMILFVAGAGTAVGSGHEPGKGPSIGIQYFAPASGMSVRYPVGQGLVIQPIVGLGMRADGENLSGRVEGAARLIYEFNRPDWKFAPYTGVGAGMVQRYSTAENGSTVLKHTLGYQGFFGVEYRQFRLAPTLEYGLGLTKTNDGKYFAGSFINAGMHYYF